MRFQEAQGATHRRRRALQAAGRPGEAALVDRRDENFHCIDAVHILPISGIVTAVERVFTPKRRYAMMAKLYWPAILREPRQYTVTARE
ncbi:hypothetical protein T190_09665 [Sinorhizobium meliloti CCBAU 01290]|nr:hypothetical protein T190_09665 [Sinorhizobium meliloti CCBAU 01290]